MVQGKRECNAVIVIVSFYFHVRIVTGTHELLVKSRASVFSFVPRQASYSDPVGSDFRRPVSLSRGQSPVARPVTMSRAVRGLARLLGTQSHAAGVVGSMGVLTLSSQVEMVRVNCIENPLKSFLCVNVSLMCK
jgi:hypothetical protein